MVVVTGVGAVCALGDDADTVFRAVCRGETGIRSPVDVPGDPAVRSWPVARVGWAGRPTGTALALRVVAEALAEAGLTDSEGLAVVGASTAGDMVLGEVAFGQHVRREPIDAPADYLWTQLCHRPTREVADAIGATGPVTTASTACTSGATAIGIAADWVRSGRVRRAIAFGTDALCGTTTAGFASLGLHSRVGCRPFDDARDGMCLGEGAAALVLEREDDAVARGARPLARLLGYGVAQDAHHLSTPEPSGAGAIRAMRAALAAAGVDPADLGYVNAHGTGTLLNDAMEGVALGQVAPNAPVSSTKGATGHTLGAAGALEAALVIRALRDGLLPPNVGLGRSGIPLELVRVARPARIDLAMSVNFAFGGHNTALIFGRAA
ncbi:MAG: beta-ketoacyl-[acyl-carrier-protein] synthase family protein [Myxococcota bacterium]